MEFTTAYAAEIVKAERDNAGDLIVFGKATGPDVDLDAQICDPTWLRKAMPEWMEWGNVREMHGAVAAGVGIELEAKGDDWWLKSKCVDPTTAKKIEEGVLKGYSIGIKGPKVIKDAAAPGGRIVGGQIVETSYVDRPCNPTATMAICKAFGMTDQLVPVDDSGSYLGAAHTEDGRLKSVSIVGLKADVTVQDDTAPGALAAEDREKAVGLIGKAIGSDGKVDETAEIEGGQAAIALIAGLIKGEADELAAGHLDQTRDIGLLVRAVDLLKYFLACEMAGDSDDDIAYVSLAAAKFGWTEEQALAVPDALRSAMVASWTKTTEPDAPAPEPAPEPVTKTPEADAPKATVSKDEVTDLVKAAVTEATKAAEERVTALAAELAKVKATPLPGGPVITAATPRQQTQDVDQTRKVAYLEQMADQIGAHDPATAAGYRKQAADLRHQLAG